MWKHFKSICNYGHPATLQELTTLEYIKALTDARKYKVIESSPAKVVKIVTGPEKQYYIISLCQ